MKTITEFSGFTLKDAMNKKAALLTEGKSEEEAQASINELLKLDEAKSPFYKNVVDMAASRVDRVKRVVVATKGSETEKVPDSYVEREGNFYLVEFYPDPNARSAPRFDDRDDRGRGGRGGGGGRGGNDRGRGGGGDRGREGGGGGDRGFGGGGERQPRFEAQQEARPAIPRPEGMFKPRIEGAPAPVFPKKAQHARPPRGEKKPRPVRDPNAPRPERAPRGPKGAGELRLVLKGESQTTLQGSGVAEAPVTEAIATPQDSSAPQA
jgi:hypothetical protein